MSKPKRPGYLQAYADHCGISRQAMQKQLIRLGIDYLQPFNFAEVDRLLDSYRHLGRDHLRRRRVGTPS
jgi:hypothetical protein